MGAPAPARTAKKASGTAKRVTAVPDVLSDDFYGPPALSRPRGAGTTGTDLADLGDLSFDTSQPVAEIAMEPFMRIDDTQYYIPVEFPPAYGLVYLDELENGRDAAVGKVLKLAIGEHGWKALRNLAETRPDLITPALMTAIMHKVMTKVMGSLEDNGEGNG